MHTERKFLKKFFFNDDYIQRWKISKEDGRFQRKIPFYKGIYEKLKKGSLKVDFKNIKHQKKIILGTISSLIKESFKRRALLKNRSCLMKVIVKFHPKNEII